MAVVGHFSTAARLHADQSVKLHSLLPGQAKRDVEFTDCSRYYHLKVKSNIMVNSVSSTPRGVLDGKGIQCAPGWVFLKIFKTEN